MFDVRSTLIGSDVVVTAAMNPTLVGLSGLVCDETYGTFTLGNRIIVKDQVRLCVDSTPLVGERLVGRSWQRFLRAGGKQ